MFMTSQSLKKHTKFRTTIKSSIVNENNKFNELFCNKKIVLKKRNLVDLVKQKPGHNRKYSNVKAYNSIPLLDNIKRYLSVEVVRETRNNKYDLIIRKLPYRQNHQSKRAMSSDYRQIKSPQYYHQQAHQNQYEYFNTQVTMSNERNQQKYQEQYSGRNLMSQNNKRVDQGKMRQFIDRKLYSRYQTLRNDRFQKEVPISYENVKCSNKIRSKSQFMIEGTNCSSFGSAVWVVNNYV